MTIQIKNAINSYAYDKVVSLLERRYCNSSNFG